MRQAVPERGSDWSSLCEAWLNSIQPETTGRAAAVAHRHKTQAFRRETEKRHGVGGGAEGMLIASALRNQVVDVRDELGVENLCGAPGHGDAQGVRRVGAGPHHRRRPVVRRQTLGPKTVARRDEIEDQAFVHIADRRRPGVAVGAVDRDRRQPLAVKEADREANHLGRRGMTLGLGVRSSAWSDSR